MGEAESAVGTASKATENRSQMERGVLLKGWKKSTRVVAAGCDRGVDLRPVAGEHPQAHPGVDRSLHRVDQMGEVPAETVELPDQ